MEKIHNRLMEKSRLYNKWHNTRGHQIVHWSLFLLVAVSVALLLRSQVEVAYGGDQRINMGKLAVNSIGLPSRKAPDHILVKFKSSVSKSKRDTVLAKFGLSEKSEIAGIKVKIVKISTNDSPDEVIDKLKAEDKQDIEFAEPDMLVPATFIPNDPYFSSQWEKSKTNAPAAWDVTQGSSTMIIGIADTGVDCTHPDLSCVAGWNFYDNTSDTHDVYGHGTAVAGTVAAIGNDGIGVAGQTLNAKIMPLRVSDANGYAYFSTIAQAITWAADHGAKVVNNSYQTSGGLAVQQAGAYLKSKGGLLTVSEGNSGTDAGTVASRNLISVSATDQNDNLYSWSSYGADVAVSAPGCVTTTNNGGSYGGWCGTSFSAPMTAGTLALIFSANPSLTADQAQNILFSTAKDLGTSGWDKYFGWGRIDASAAVSLARSMITTATTSTATTTTSADTIPPSAPSNLVASSVSASQVVLSWTASTDNVGVAGYKVYRNGALIGTSVLNTYTDTTVSASSTYTYSVFAYDAANNLSTVSNVITVTIPSVVIQPTQVAITSRQLIAKTTTSATVQWTTNVPSTGSLSLGPIPTNLNVTSSDNLQGTTHTVTINGLSSSTVYYYKIQATSIDGASNTSTGISSLKTSKR